MARLRGVGFFIVKKKIFCVDLSPDSGPKGNFTMRQNETAVIFIVEPDDVKDNLSFDILILFLECSLGVESNTTI